MTRQIAYKSIDTTHISIKIAVLNGTDITVMNSYPINGSHLSWSPDGMTLAFIAASHQLGFVNAENGQLGNHTISVEEGIFFPVGWVADLRADIR